MAWQGKAGHGTVRQGKESAAESSPDESPPQ